MSKLHNAHQQPCLHPHSWFWNLCGYRKKKYATKSLSPSLQTDPSGDQISENERHRLTLPMKFIYVRPLGSWVTSENYQWQRSHLYNRYTSTRYPSSSFTPPHPSRTTFLPRIPSATSSETAWLYTPAMEVSFFLKSVRKDPHTPLGHKVPSECSAMLLSFNDINNSSDKFLIPKKTMFLSVPWNPKPMCDFSVSNHLLVPRCQNVF